MSEAGESVIARVRSLLEELLRIVQTRLELLAAELEQEKLQLARDLRLAALCAICIWLTGFTLVIWAALALTARARFIVLGALSGLFLLASIATWIALKRSRRRAPVFSRVLAQLRLDRQSLERKP